MPNALELLDSEITTCTKCDLHKSRKNAVPGEGPKDAKIMIIGEGPGQNEDEQGRPFVGAAGKLLTELLETIGLNRSDVFITNIVKCRPPNNRAPRVSEIEACNPYLMSQIDLVKPRIICLLGTPAITTLLGKEFTATKSHGKPTLKENRLIIPMYHPAVALYDASLRGVLEADFGTLKKILAQFDAPKNRIAGARSENDLRATLENWV